MPTLCGFAEAMFICGIGQPPGKRALAFIRSRSREKVSEFQDA
jgi:hypothetical protein